jgi:hypothetical protein
VYLATNVPDFISAAMRFAQRASSNIVFSRDGVRITSNPSFFAGDIGKCTSAFQVLNADHIICNMERSVKI